MPGTGKAGPTSASLHVGHTKWCFISILAGTSSTSSSVGPGSGLHLRRVAYISGLSRGPRKRPSGPIGKAHCPPPWVPMPGIMDTLGEDSHVQHRVVKSGISGPVCATGTHTVGYGTGMIPAGGGGRVPAYGGAGAWSAWVVVPGRVLVPVPALATSWCLTSHLGLCWHHSIRRRYPEGWLGFILATHPATACRLQL